VSAIGSFVALGDSFSEGIGDPYPDGRGYRGWADRFASRLAVFVPGLRYANLAVRGKIMAEVVRDQLPAAVRMSPDLVSIAAGGNDLLRFSADPDQLAAALDDAVSQLRGAGCDVLMFTGFDPRTFPVIRLVRGKAAVFNMHIREIAERRLCRLVDLWAMRILTDRREWCPDRLHLSPDGHRRVALRACEVMGIPVEEDWREPLPGPAPARTRPGAWLQARLLDARWAREHAMPWVSRRLRGVSTGDGIPPKRPELLPLDVLPGDMSRA